MKNIDYLHEMGITIWVPRTVINLSAPAKKLLDAIALAIQLPCDIKAQHIYVQGVACFSVDELERLVQYPDEKKQIWQRLIKLMKTAVSA